MIGKRRTLVWTAAFILGLAIVAAVYGLIITQPGDLQQRDLYPSLFVERVIEHSVYPLWSPRGTFNIAGTGRLPITLILVGFAKLFALDGATYARLIILWIVFAAYTSGFFGFSLLSRWRSGGGSGGIPAGALICGVIAAVNPWTIARLEHSWMMAQWAVVPIVVGTFAEGLRTGRRRWILGSALIMAAFGTTQPHYLVITTGMIFLTTVVIAVRGAGKPVRSFTDLGLWVLILLPLSAHFIAPYAAAKLLAGTGDPAYTLTDQTLTTISRFQDLPGTLLGTGNFNWQSVLAPSGPERVIWSIAAWVVALTPLAAVLLAGWRRPAVTLAAGAYLVAVFIAMSHWDCDGRAVSTGGEQRAWILGLSGTRPHGRLDRVVAGALPRHGRHQPHGLARPAAASARPLGADGISRSRRRVPRGARDGKRPLEIQRVELRAEVAARGLPARAASG